MMRPSRAAIALCAALAAGTPSVRAGDGEDPLRSVMWPDLSRRYFGDARVEFDERVKVVVPGTAENQAQVPITADARVLGPVEKLIVFADLNPIPFVLALYPDAAAAYVSVRIKVEQATPVRSAALTADGVWHVGGTFLDAAGGGCSAPTMARQDADWSQTLGQARGRLWREADGTTRARFRIRHPMDTGLAKDNAPAYYIERIEMRSASGQSLARLELSEPVSEDPTLTLIARLANGERGVDVEGRDNNGAIYRSHLPAVWNQSTLGGATPTERH